MPTWNRPDRGKRKRTVNPEQPATFWGTPGLLPRDPIEEMPATPDAEAMVELLRGELLAVHDELTELTAERAARSWRPRALTLDMPGGMLGSLKGRAREFRRRGVTVVKDTLSGRLEPRRPRGKPPGSPSTSWAACPGRHWPRCSGSAARARAGSWPGPAPCCPSTRRGSNPTGPSWTTCWRTATPPAGSRTPPTGPTWTSCAAWPRRRAPSPPRWTPWPSRPTAHPG